MYAQIGSGNGGVVVNLGLDGVACQAANRLTARRNSSFILRLRGSGLNLELVGEVVWLGATQKEVGIQFKNLSVNAKNCIAEWIAREVQPSESVARKSGPRPKPLPAMSGIFETRDRSAAQPLSTALAMSRSESVAPDSSAGAEDLSLPASCAPGARSGTVKPPEILSPTQHRDVDADQPIEQEYASPYWKSVRNDFFEKAIPEAGEQHVRSAMQPSPERERYKAKTFLKTLRARVLRPALDFPDSPAAARWIPPALLALWKRGNRRRKLLLVCAGAVGVGILGLILTLAVAGFDTPLRQTERSGAPQLSNLPAAASTPLATAQAPALPRKPQPRTSVLTGLVNKAMGRPYDAKTEMDEDQTRMQVWTSKRTGYYYCTDNEVYKTVQPGSFMNQGEALQSGYRSILGRFCD